jgi:DNA-binding beta-propeller fold protein YncE
MQKISGLGLETTVETAFETTGYTIQVFYDENNGKIYYSDDDNGQVVRVNPDGSEQEIVAEGIAGPRGLAVNEDASQLFVADRGADEILSFDLSTGEKTVLYDSTDLANAIADAEFQPVAFLPEGLTFHNGELFFTCVDFDAETLWKASADGSSVERLLDYGDAGFGYSVIVDTENDVLIFDDADTNNLLSSAFDGSDISELVATDDYTYGIGIDYVTSKIYWSTRDGSVKRANRDGSEVETLVSADEGRTNRGLVVVPTN